MSLASAGSRGVRAKNGYLLDLAAEGVHFGEDFGGFGFQGIALLGEVVVGVFAGFVLEVQVAEIVVDHFFALAEVVEAGLFDDSAELWLRPENVGEAG